MGTLSSMFSYIRCLETEGKFAQINRNIVTELQY